MLSASLGPTSHGARHRHHRQGDVHVVELVRRQPLAHLEASEDLAQHRRESPRSAAVSARFRALAIDSLNAYPFFSPRNQLVEQMRHVREEKRRLRRAIRDMEADVLRQQSATSIRYSGGSNANADETGDPFEPVYAQYRHARAKLRLLEALVAKHDGSATL